MPCEDADVWLGTKSKVPLVTAADASITMPKRLRKDMKVEIVYDGPLAAPVTAGKPVGKLIITTTEMAPVEIPLVAGASVDALGPMGRLGNRVAQLVFGKPH